MFEKIDESGGKQVAIAWKSKLVLAFARFYPAFTAYSSQLFSPEQTSMNYSRLNVRSFLEYQHMSIDR